mmetsp:Transcript_20727/g.29898  ORF Transcript_20727/g.29898 Transcript_20727/m.29898 type:complete len:410 (-) Transcript_20727:142-1371(-)
MNETRHRTLTPMCYLVFSDLVFTLPYLTAIHRWGFSDTDQSDVLGPEMFGTHPGLGDDYEITDGVFANYTIPMFDESFVQYEQYITNESDVYYAGNRYGYLREINSELYQPVLTAFPSDPSFNHSAIYIPYDLDHVWDCFDCGYDDEFFHIFHFSWCVQENWHTFIHADLGGFRYDDDGVEYAGDFSGQQATIDPIFIPYHNTLDMFFSMWMNTHSDYSNVSWGFPYERAFNYLDNTTYHGIRATDTISATFPFTWMDVGWADPDSPKASNKVTFIEALCYYSEHNRDYIYVKYSGAPDDAPGEVVGAREGEIYTALGDGDDITSLPYGLETHMANSDENDVTTTATAEESSPTTLETTMIDDSGLYAAEAFLETYSVDSDNRLEAANAFMETLQSSPSAESFSAEGKH